MLNHTKRNDRRQAMLDAIEPYSHSKDSFIQINLSSVFHDYDLEGDLDAFWYFLREIIDGLAEGALIRIPNNLDAHTFCRVLRETFEHAGVYDELRIRTQTTKLRIYNTSTLQFPTSRTVCEDGKRKITPVPAWEIHCTPNVAENNHAKS